MKDSVFPKDKVAGEIASLSEDQLALLKMKARRRLIDGHTLIARELRHLGVTHVYSLSGTPVDETLGACVREGIRVIGVHHQQSGVMMANAQNYVAGRLVAVVIVSAGPAVTNTVTGVLVAWDNGWPVLVLGGRRPLAMQGMGSFQELNAIPIFQSLTKWATVVEKTADIPEYLCRAMKIAISDRPGPVYLDLPEETLFGQVQEREYLSLPELTLPSAEQAAVSSAAELLRGAKRPLVIIGKGVRWSAPFDELRQLVENWQMPFITSPMGQGVLPDDHPLCFNVMRTTVQSSCDLVLVLGARLDWTFRYGAELAPDARLIHVDIDPRAHGNTVEPKVALLGDVKVVMQQLLKEMGLPVAREIGGSSWLRTLQEQRRTQLKLLTADMEHDREGPISAQVLVAELKQAIPEDAICVLDGNLILAAAQDGLSSHLPASRFTPGSNGCIGVGVPFGIGAKLSSPQRPVVVICGDTAFSISAMEMETAVRHDIPLVVVVANNDGISGTIKQHTHFPPGHERVTMFMPGIRYEQMVEISGGHGEYVDHVDQVRPAMERALASGLPACVHVRVSS